MSLTSAQVKKALRDYCETYRLLGVDSMEKLKGVPIEAEFDGGQRLTGWRILKEVL